MKKLGIVIFLVCQIYISYSQELVLTVENIKEAEGQLIISLFTNSEDFLKRAVYEKYIPLKYFGSMKIVLDDVPNGNYALCVIHDANNNGNIDTNFLKIPKEAYGFSHNPKSRFGPPKFEDAEFVFNKPLGLTVYLN